MLPTRGRLLFDSLKSTFMLSSPRFATVPQTSTGFAETSPLSIEKQKKEPFMKNVFLGRFDYDFLSFSENNRIDRPNKLKELARLFQEYCDQHTAEPGHCHEYLQFLAKHGFFSLSLPQGSSDLSITNTEILRFYENLNLNPSLAILLEIHSSFIIPALVKYASSEQKDLYLNKLLDGKISGAYAFHEERGSSDPSSLNLSVIQQGEHFILNGEKYWVTNAVDANFYVVFATSSIDQMKNNKTDFFKDISVFLVDKNEQIAVQEHNLLGLNGCSVGKVKFVDHSISRNNLLSEIGNGYKIASEGLGCSKFIVLSCILNNLKNLISIITVDINNRKHFPRDPKDTDLIKHKISNLASVAYCLESMMYFTCDILDKYVIDTSLESMLLQIYGLNEGFQAIMQCLELLDHRSYDKSYEFEKLFRDLRGLKLFTTDIDVAKLYSSLVGLDFVGNSLRDTIFKNRNPFNYPTYIFKKMIHQRRLARGDPKLTLKLFMNLHPSLKPSADKLEHCVLQFSYAVELLLTRHGSEIVNRQLELLRISEIALNIFTMTAVLARASHSYCTGKRYCDQEVLLAQTICFDLFVRTKSNLVDLINVDTSLTNAVSLGIGTTVLNAQKYFFENPEKSNFQ